MNFVLKKKKIIILFWKNIGKQKTKTKQDINNQWKKETIIKSKLIDFFDKKLGNNYSDIMIIIHFLFFFYLKKINE